MTTSPPDRGAAASTPPPTGVVVLDVGADPAEDRTPSSPSPSDRVRTALQTSGIRCLVLVVDGSVDGWSDETILAVADASVPVVAVLRGPVGAHAAAVAVAADLRVAEPTATLRVEPLVGATSVTLPRVVGGASARLLLLAPRTLDAREARERGLLHEVDDTDALGAAMALASAVAVRAGAGAAVRRALASTGAGDDVATALAEEARLRAVVELHGPA